MNQHVAAIGATVAPDEQELIVLDSAGWHRSSNLLIPPILTPLNLPPKG